nr:hypothetical protein [Desulfobacterales bacterium]
MRKILIQHALGRTKGTKSKAAKLLGLTRMLLRTRIRKYNFV